MRTVIPALCLFVLPLFLHLQSSLAETVSNNNHPITAIFIDDYGNVAIGTDTIPSDTKLAVAGNLTAESILIRLQSDWPDYVFSQSYSLRSLDDLEKFIKKKGHLPGIPSEQEVKEKGVNIGKLNARLLEKIEELSLYLIEQNKVIKKQSAALSTLTTQMKELKKAHSE